jgi:hypothetical protein
MTVLAGADEVIEQEPSLLRLLTAGYGTKRRLFAPLLGAKRTSISVVAAGLLTLKSTIW